MTVFRCGTRYRMVQMLQAGAHGGRAHMALGRSTSILQICVMLWLEGRRTAGRAGRGVSQAIACRASKGGSGALGHAQPVPKHGSMIRRSGRTDRHSARAMQEEGAGGRCHTSKCNMHACGMARLQTAAPPSLGCNALVRCWCSVFVAGRIDIGVGTHRRVC
jgi:hypothetical protein